MLPLKEGRVEIFGEKHFLQNAGRKPATNIEFIFSWPPDDVTVWQPREYEKSNLQNGEYSLKIPSIAPGELIIIDSIYLNKKGAFIASVKCSEALGQHVDFITNRNFGLKFNIAAATLLFLGIAFIVQTVVGFILETKP